MDERIQPGFTSGALKFLRSQDRADFNALMKFVYDAYNLAMAELSRRLETPIENLKEVFSVVKVYSPNEMPAPAPLAYNSITDELAIDVSFCIARYLKDNDARLLASGVVHEIEHFIQKDIGTLPKINKPRYDEIPWENDPIELGAEVQRVRYLLDSGISEEEIKSRYMKNNVIDAETAESIIDAAKDIAPYSTTTANDV